MEGETDRLPDFYVRRIEHDLGELYPHLPPGGIMHDPTAYLKSSAAAASITPLTINGRGTVAAESSDPSPNHSMLAS
jgi:hypothetical protein